MKEEFCKVNEELERLGKQIFGESATLRVVDPGSVTLRRNNARFFKKEVFTRLVDNLREDSRLSSVPLCYEPQPGVLEVLSGNHRVKASLAAGLPRILVMVLVGVFTEAHLTAIQLSHNALVGQDDAQMLAALWARVDSIRDRLYAGLSSDHLGEIERVRLVTFTTPTLATRTLTFAFVDTDAKRVEEVLDSLAALGKGATVYVAEAERFEAFWRLLQAAKVRANIKNGSLALARLVEFAQTGMEVAA
jgi:hypothetical protein